MKIILTLIFSLAFIYCLIHFIFWFNKAELRSICGGGIVITENFENSTEYVNKSRIFSNITK